MSGLLVFIGLGLRDGKDITLRGLEVVKMCDTVFAEFYTSVLPGTAPEELERQLGKKITVLSREQVESEKVIIEKAKNGKVAFLTAGDPMAATTHVSLRLKAIELGIETRIIHNASILSAAAGILGLQHYKFGRTTSIAFRSGNYKPASSYDVLAENFKMGLHTLILLDLKPDEKRFMSANEGLELLMQMEREQKKGIFTEKNLVCVVGTAGSDKPVVRAGTVADLLKEDFGAPPHSIIVPGKLHFMEEEALRKIAGMK